MTRFITICLSLFVIFTISLNCVRITNNNAEEKRLIELGVNQKPVWLTESEILQLISKRIHFMDVTDYEDLRWKKVNEEEAVALPKNPQQKPLVNRLNTFLSADNLKTNVQTLSSFATRYYKTTSGEEAAGWIKSTLEAYAGDRKDVQIYYFPHPNDGWLQPSVIARINGTVTTKETVILGAHEDSVNQLGVNKNAPGVDDDGSGTVTNLEVFRVLMENNFVPNRTVEFHFYAAEESGLLGSSQIAKNYSAENKNIVGMMQLDMVFFVGQNTEVIALNRGNLVDDKLTNFTAQLVDAYSELPWVDTRCGYACSDFASWTRNGYRSVFPFETKFLQSNPHVHTTKDTLEYANLNHGIEFGKIALGFIVELAATQYIPA